MILHDGRVMESLMMIARGLVSEASWSSVRNFQKMPKQNFPVGVPGVPSVLIAGSDPDYFVIGNSSSKFCLVRSQAWACCTIDLVVKLDFTISG
jgi:hypothetical protein